MKNRRRQTHKKWTFGFIGIVLLMLVAVGIFNFSVDSVGVFHLNKDIPFAASNLLKGKLVAGLFGYADERKLQILLIEGYTGQREAIALGSSRTMLLRKAHLHDGNIDFFNHAVAGATLKDYIAIVGAYRAKGRLPKTVIFSLDPWLFNKDNGLLEAWKVMDKYYTSMMSELEGVKEKKSLFRDISSRIKKSTELINLENTMQNWYRLQSGNRLYSKAHIRVVDSVGIDDFVREPDGSLHFPYAIRYAKKIEVKGQEDEVSVKYLRDYREITDRDLFEKLVLFLKNQGTEVVFLIPPFHPSLYRLCEKDSQYAIAFKIETYLQSFAKEHDIPVYGNLDPSRYNLTGADFSDWIHGQDIVMEKILQNYTVK